MRPVKLIIRAFGPYADEQVLDFRGLGDRSLFLIHGATGSGKTTILDAISFALFGVCSGGDRESRRIRSDYADPSTPTEVTFDFLLRGRSYRIYRMPEQNRPKKKGGGVTIARAEARLSDRTTAGDDSDEGQIVAAQWNNVTEAVEGLLGFRSSQFRQVVMLPQGKFREFLDADSKERQAILDVLFQTELYRRIEEALKQSAKNLESRIHETKQHVRFLLDQTQSESAGELGLKIEEYKSALNTNRNNLDRLREIEKEAREKLEEGRRIIEKFNEVRQAQENLSALEQRVQEFSDKRAVLDRARKAVALAAEENAFEKRLREAEEANNSLKIAEQTLEKVRTRRIGAEKDFAVENARQNDRDEARRNLGRLEELGPQVRELETAAKRQRGIEKEVSRLAKELEQTSELCVDYTGRIDAARRNREYGEKVVLRAEILEIKYKEGEKVLQGLQRLESLKKEESSAASDLALASRRLQEVEESLELGDAELKSLESAWIDGQAAIIAASLSPGSPCPVCGSKDHPSPAKTAHPLPDEKAIKTKRKEVDKRRQLLEKLRGEKAAEVKKTAEIQAKREALSESLNDHASEAFDEFEARLNTIRDELQDCLETIKNLAALKEELVELERSSAMAHEKQKSAKEKYDQAASEMQRARTEIETRQAHIPEKLRQISLLERETQRTRENVTRLDAALEQARQALANANDEFSAGEAAHKAAQEAAALSAQRSLAQREQFLNNIRAVGFADQDDFRSSRLVPSRMEHLEREIREFDSAFNAAADRNNRAAQAAKDLVRPDLNALESAAAGSRSKLDTALKETAVLEGKIGNLSAILADHDNAARRMKSLEAEYAVVGRISDVAGGRNREGIAFQRFVLAALLDDVLRTASKRLRSMTNNRFSIQRVTDRADKRTAGGLDLEVHDTYTGTARPVSTLSGGESFLASLSLALGLADVVQAYAGGIQLDTIFVDEGFGSLDPEVLDLAFRTLADLQQNGRLVGIISHVPELRERIDARLEVSGDRVGSKARFVVG